MSGIIVGGWAVSIALALFLAIHLSVGVSSARANVVEATVRQRSFLPPAIALGKRSIGVPSSVLQTSSLSLSANDGVSEVADAGRSAKAESSKAEGIVMFFSHHSFEETVDRIKFRLAELNVPVFAIFDHGDNALKAGLQLRPTKVVVFGNAKVGTKLMQENQAIALDLPLRVSIWEDERERVWVGYRSLQPVANELALRDLSTVERLDGFIADLISHSVQNAD